MNPTETPGAIFRLVYRYALRARWLLGKQTCRAFDQVNDEVALPSIERIYVINLDRQPFRWKQIKQELTNVLDASGTPLSARTNRISAVDARQFGDTVNVHVVERMYTLGDQLFVDPRRVLPQRLDLDEQIEMSRQEIAVALSHIDVWKRVAAGHDEYVLILEDDVLFRCNFAYHVDRVWQQLCTSRKGSTLFDVLYLSFKEVDHGAEKTRVSENVFKLFRGLWYLSGYVLSKRGAKKLLNLLPVRGPVDLWINHKFDELDVLASTKSVIVQRMDERSENSYSILPVLSKIGVLNSEGPGIFRSRPLVKPVFAIGATNSGLTSLAMALSMLGYRCCSDLDDLPKREENGLLFKNGTRMFDAYVNIGSLERYLDELAELYPESRLIIAIEEDTDTEATFGTQRWSSDRVLILPSNASDKWKLLCEFLGNVPPAAPYPALPDLGRRQSCLTKNGSSRNLNQVERWLEADTSPWITSLRDGWNGVPLNGKDKSSPVFSNASADITDNLNRLDDSRWLLRDDTFPGNLALFQPSNFSINDGGPAEIMIRNEDMGVRQYSSGALTTRARFLFGRFEVVLKPPRIPGLITGAFMQRNSPRQEIDIEFLGKDTRKILFNVFYNPGDEGARFDYGYRGTPVLIDLGFDASSDFHNYAIEWGPNELRWFVDDQLVHKRLNWAPTPIPHLPMRFHVNLWPSRSSELAGRLSKKLLPTTVLIRSVRFFLK